MLPNNNDLTGLFLKINLIFTNIISIRDCTMIKIKGSRSYPINLSLQPVTIAPSVTLTPTTPTTKHYGTDHSI